MGQSVSRDDFEWLFTDQPHKDRREKILNLHPEIKELFGFNPTFKWHVVLLVLFQIITIPIVCQLKWPHLLILAYFFGGVINHVLSLAQHEITHNMAFGNGRPSANRWFGIFANLPLGVPMSASFKKYHILHHRYLSVDGIDPDLPTSLEAKLFCTTLGKLLWVVLQPLFYLLRPILVCPLQISRLEVYNVIIQFTFDAAVVYFYGWKPLVYLISGTLLTMGLHPIGGHLIAEHYMFRTGFETYSYYGCLNALTFNVGYHNEHHDFPAIPGCNLPKLRVIAREFYDPLPHHTSWIKVIVDFILDPSIGPYARVKREKLQ
ncbi:unnamed protein product [Allacma fusca]|uniref:sphingolipid 4-desaturase n=1 Tax=Allacma fusca TaxID=39272 RepID=A0A8J2LQ95_9HEXA|nr:unnamed protein product [Allacma fusca]